MKNLITICLLITINTSIWAQDAPEQIKKVTFPVGYSSQLNLVYTTAPNWEGKMDLYLPPKSKGLSPAIINIHGGGWSSGTKDTQGGFNSYFNKGFLVANIAYRLSGQAAAPAAIEDTRCALIYLIKNAKTLNIDVNKIVIMGGSAGGHLALMGGLLANDNRFDTNCAGEKSVKVAAIIDKYGIVDVGDKRYGSFRSGSEKKWLGNKVADQSFIESVSPIYIVKKDSPPIFIVHGDADPTVPIQQSYDLKKRLDEVSVKNEMMIIPGGLHGKFTSEQNAEVNEAILEFIYSLDAFKK
ncbi:lipase [Pedobacter psychrophilus]|uniref:Lipase n=1 Tax=Pedobacter psychrophilus TaxID=1826909 RepID=A0A179DB53_9SPHI|nr:alpha/beta hydrolase [Pedobacter psychrophilus]OAQ38276.1 lipase [Pedobacter psychrophilus]